MWQKITLTYPHFSQLSLLEYILFQVKKSKRRVKFFLDSHCRDSSYWFLPVDPFFPSPLETSMFMLMPLNILPCQVQCHLFQ